MSYDFCANLEQFRENSLVTTIYHSSRLGYLPFSHWLLKCLVFLMMRTVIHNLDEFAIKEKLNLLFSHIYWSQTLKTFGSIEN